MPSGIMIMTKHDQLVRVSINSIQCNSVICVCMHYSVLNVLISVHVVDPLSHLHAVIRKYRYWFIYGPSVRKEQLCVFVIPS